MIKMLIYFRNNSPSRALELYISMKNVYKIYPDCSNSIWNSIFASFNNNENPDGSIYNTIYEDWKKESKSYLNPGFNLLLIGLSKSGQIQTLKNVINIFILFYLILI